MFIFKSAISTTSQYCLIPSFSKVPKATDNTVGLKTTEGSRDLAFDEYLDMIKSFDVDSAVSFSDEVPITIGKRRGKQSVARSKAWLLQQLERSDKKSRIIANIQATDNMELSIWANRRSKEKKYFLRFIRRFPRFLFDS